MWLQAAANTHPSLTPPHLLLVFRPLLPHPSSLSPLTPVVALHYRLCNLVLTSSPASIGCSVYFSARPVPGSLLPLPRSISLSNPSFNIPPAFHLHIPLPVHTSIPGQSSFCRIIEQTCFYAIVSVDPKESKSQKLVGLYEYEHELAGFRGQRASGHWTKSVCPDSATAHSPTPPNSSLALTSTLAPGQSRSIPVSPI